MMFMRRVQSKESLRNLLHSNHITSERNHHLARERIVQLKSVIVVPVRASILQYLGTSPGAAAYS